MDRVRILSPIPSDHVRQAGAMWWRQFGGTGRVPAMHAARGAVALRGGTVIGVAGFRGSDGGFAQRSPALAGMLFRAAPATDDLVLDGITVTSRRDGVGALLVQAALERARDLGRPGVQAEVALRNRTGVAFFQRIGFVEVGRGRFGWPWTGQVLVMRRSVLAEDARGPSQQHERAG